MEHYGLHINGAGVMCSQIKYGLDLSKDSVALLSQALAHKSESFTAAAVNHALPCAVCALTVTYIMAL